MRRGLNDGLLHVTIAGALHRSIPDTVVHRSHRLDRVDVVHRADGIRVTSPPRTVFDLSAMLSTSGSTPSSSNSSTTGCTMATLVATGGGWASVAARVSPLREGAAERPRAQAGRLRPRAPLGAGLHCGRAASTPASGSGPAARGQLVRPDFLWRPQGEALEIDHVTWHGGKIDLTATSVATPAPATNRHHLKRITDEDVRRRLGAVIDDLGAILADLMRDSTS